MTFKDSPSQINLLGVAYTHVKTAGDLYLTELATDQREFLETENWYEKDWFSKNRVRLPGTSSVYRVPTKEVDGKRLELVVKNCRVGEDVPLNTHTLLEHMSTEFNSPWEEFSLVMEMRDRAHLGGTQAFGTQRPLAIYVPPEKMQPWQSGRVRSRVRRILARHPGVDLDILKQYKLVYEWIEGKNVIELLTELNVPTAEIVHHLKIIQRLSVKHLKNRGYLVADMKPEHVIINSQDCLRIEAMARKNVPDQAVIDAVHSLVETGEYSIIDYELLFRTPELEDEVLLAKSKTYQNEYRQRFTPSEVPAHLTMMEIFETPYIYGRAESTGGHLWVVGKNARLFDYFLPERWRKTPSLSLSDTNEVFYTVTKDDIHLVWKTSRVGEIPPCIGNDCLVREGVKNQGINSPFEEAALSIQLQKLGIPTAPVLAIYMTGTRKIENSEDERKYALHKKYIDGLGMPILSSSHNYISLRAYYTGPKESYDTPLVPVDLKRAAGKNIITQEEAEGLLLSIKQRILNIGYDGALLTLNDVLIVTSKKDNNVVTDADGSPLTVVCNFELIRKAACSPEQSL